MATEGAGRSDKLGNRYEYRWGVYQILQIVKEKIASIKIEAIGDDEKGMDIWVYQFDGTKEGQQCKIRNASNPNWTISSAEQLSIFSNWKFQLDSNINNNVALVSPVPFNDLQDLISRANNSDGNAKDFYEYQIKNGSKKFISFYHNYCQKMGLDYDKEENIIKSIEYLKRTCIHNFPEEALKGLIKENIELLFIGNYEDIYDLLICYIADNDVWGKKIDLLEINKLLTKHGITRRNLSNDKSILPRIEQLNFEYSNSLRLINNRLIISDKVNECIKNIEENNSIIIHGKSGIGKSGCTEGIINYCKEKNVPYIALKLDKRTPEGSANKWGEKLDLSSSVAHCINVLSNNKKAIIILDQLDALRWTQAHSSEALDVCIDLIKQVNNINIDRKEKIIIIFVCRTYDLENDTRIQSLFETSVSKILWKKVSINELDDKIVESIVGNVYKEFGSKLKKLLKIPSNLYIWTLLTNKTNHNDITTTSHLIEKWWEEIKQKGVANGLLESEIELTKDNIIDYFIKNNKLVVNKNILSLSSNVLHHMLTTGFIIINENKISFCHQSLVDYFISIKMVKDYIENKNILKICGDFNNQFPSKRYQLQLFFQNIYEIDEDLFLEAGNNILQEANIRFYLKYVFFEVLGQIETPSSKIINYVKELYNSKYKKHIINTVLLGHCQYIYSFISNEEMSKWWNTEKDIVIRLLISIKPNYSKEIVQFIRNLMFKNKDDDKKLSRCFDIDINNDTDEIFALRMEYYDVYPEFSYEYINFKAMLQKCEMRTIRLLHFWINSEKNQKDKNIYRYEEELLNDNDEIFIENYQEVIDILINDIPLVVEDYGLNNEWSGKSHYNNGIERTCVEILKKANKSLINKKPEKFIEKYKAYMGRGYKVFNEIILDGLLQFSIEDSDYIINYLISDFENNIFDKTSKNKDELSLTKKIISKFSPHCSIQVFEKLQNVIIGYIPSDMYKVYKMRYDYNKNSKQKYYYSFWGDLQFELLQVLPKNLVSKKSIELLQVLKRKYKNGTHKFIYYGSHFGTVHSPIEGKKLNDAQWRQIICNRKIKKGRSSHKEVDDGFIENSIYEFASSFRSAVSSEPLRMLNLVLNCDNIIVDEFYDSLLSGLSSSENIDEVPNELIEKLFKKIGYNYESQTARNISWLIAQKENTDWSDNTLMMLKDIALNHKDPILGTPNVTTADDQDIHSVDMLQSNAFNCVRGEAALAIEHILWTKKENYSFFKEVLEKMIEDKNPVIQFASLYILLPVYNIDKDFSSEKILNLYEKDERFLSFQYSRNILHKLYNKYRERVLDLVERNINSTHESVRKVCVYTMAEFFILHNEFEKIFSNINALTTNQIEETAVMLTNYYDEEKYNDKIKDIFLKIRNNEIDLEYPISKLFYDNCIDIKRDKEFIIKIMNEKSGRRSLHAFIQYLKNKEDNVRNYAEIILEIAKNIVLNIEKDGSGDIMWIIDDIITLIIQLFDESVNLDDEKSILISNQCLDIWDIMYEKEIGSVRTLSKQLLER